jgi:hypothetical protein
MESAAIRDLHPIQPARREIEGGDGSLRTASCVGIQLEQADERIGGPAKARTGRVIRCEILRTMPPMVQSESSQKTMTS